MGEENGNSGPMLIKPGRFAKANWILRYSLLLSDFSDLNAKGRITLTCQNSAAIHGNDEDFCHV